MKVTKDKIASVWQGVVHDQMMTQQVFRENEILANLLISKSMLGAAGVLIICWLLNVVGVLAISSVYVLPIFLVGSISLVVPAGISLIYHGEKTWIKYLLLISVTAVLAYLDSILTFNVPLLIILPVVFSCRYYSCSITIKTAVFTTVLFAVSAWCGAVINFRNPDLNFANTNMDVYVHDVMLLSFLPKWLVFSVVSAFCYEIAGYGRKMVLKQNEISQKAARVNTELEMAGNIQNQALPTVDSLPDNCFRHFDLAAEMLPAKEVGGDFFDFFYPDPTHLALIIGDVADKGIAASLYMMMSKTLLNSRLSMTLSPGQVLESVNRQLFADSPKGMFVTVWLGIVDLKTGELVMANAGHEYPVLQKKNGNFEIIKDKHGFVLGGWRSTKFPEHRISLSEGDTLFVYTDGVPEATDVNGVMFGTERMLESLNRNKNRGMHALLDGLKSDINLFVSDAPQFDDTTMLAFQLQESAEEAGISADPVIEELDNIQEYISNTIGQNNISTMQANMISIAVDEIFSNIVKYSQAKHVWILCEVENNSIQITFRDDGIPFDPLTVKRPAVPNKKIIGGLGILITRKIMDRVEYQYENSMNCLTITSIIKEDLL